MRGLPRAALVWLLGLLAVGCLLACRILLFRPSNTAPSQPTAWAEHLLGTVKWPGNPLTAGPPVGTPQDSLHYVDVGSAFINSSLLAFVSSYPRGPEFAYHLIEPNPRTVQLYRSELDQLRVPPAQVEIQQAAAWRADNQRLKSDGLGLANAALSPALQALGSGKLRMLAKRILEAHPTWAGCSVESDCSGWEAATIDLARWLKSKFHARDWVVLKLDIEGGEWTVLPHLLESEGAAALIDELYIEWHPDDKGTQLHGRKAFIGGRDLFGRREADIAPLVQRLKEAGIKLVGRWP